MKTNRCANNQQSEFYPVQQSISKGHRLPSLFSTTSEPFHASLRRSVNSAFSMSTLIQYEPFVDSTTELFLAQTEKLYSSPDQPCNFSKWLQFYAFDVIGEMTYSKRHGFLGENRDIDGIIGYVSWLFDYAAPVCLDLPSSLAMTSPSSHFSLVGIGNPLTQSRSDKFQCSTFCSSRMNSTYSQRNMV
jgi:hypothetical protein